MRNVARVRSLISRIKNKTQKPSEEIPTRPFPDKDPRLVLEITMDRFQQQQHQIDSLDEKLSSLSGLGGALLAILAAVLALGEKPLHAAAIISLYISIGAYILIMIGFVFSYTVHKFDIGPSLSETWEYAKQYGDDKMQWWAAESFKRCYENNKARLKLKIFVIRADVLLSTIQAIALIVAIKFAI